MAKPCVCGCGRELGWGNARVAKNADQILRRLPMVHRVAKVLAAHDMSGAANAARFVEIGCDNAYWVLKDAHGDKGARAFMPSLGQVLAWCRKADELVAPVWGMDEAWATWWLELGCPIADASKIGGGSRLGAKWDGQLLLPSNAPPAPPISAKRIPAEQS
jgi:hypothetical protein